MKQRRITRAVLTIGLLISLGLGLSSCLGSLFDQPPNPVVKVVQGTPSGPAPLTVTFDISESSDPDGRIVSFTFDFADGSAPVHGTDLTQPIVHTYTVPGQHFATLTVRDDAGRTAIAQVMIVVQAESEGG